ncbi:MAG: DeoR family transcriptional regulator [Desulfobacterales bacterium]|nr:DeoR family transcriptional regulator [Desulfobacterales bacterium]
MKCETCLTAISPGEGYEHSGRTLCEDCYLDVVAAPKTCDPWAVYSAKNTMSQEVTLTHEQQKILDLIKARGPIDLEQICAALGITEEEFRRDFATLRHMELAGACQKEGQICFTLFDNPSD